MIYLLSLHSQVLAEQTGTLKIFTLPAKERPPLFPRTIRIRLKMNYVQSSNIML